MGILTDSYKASHALQYPPGASKFVAVRPGAPLWGAGLASGPRPPQHNHPSLLPRPQYGEFRRGYDGDAADTRLVWYGVRYIVETYLHRRWTVGDVERSAAFYATHLAPAHGPFPFPRDLFLKFVAENEGAGVWGASQRAGGWAPPLRRRC